MLLADAWGGPAQVRELAADARMIGPQVLDADRVPSVLHGALKSVVLLSALRETIGAGDPERAIAVDALALLGHADGLPQLAETTAPLALAWLRSGGRSPEVRDPSRVAYAVLLLADLRYPGEILVPGVRVRGAGVPLVGAQEAGAALLVDARAQIEVIGVPRASVLVARYATPGGLHRAPEPMRVHGPAPVRW